MTDAKLKSLVERKNKSLARLRVVNEAGDLYAAASADGLWIKIGFSTQLAVRLRALNYDHPSAGPFTLIGSTRSTFYVEQRLHSAVRPFHQIHIGAGKELYPAAPAVLTIVRALVAKPTLERIDIDDLLALRRWCRAQADLDENKQVAHIAHAPRFAARDAAARRNLERVLARIAAREAAQAAA